jgi:hypothetical protein
VTDQTSQNFEGAPLPVEGLLVDALTAVAERGRLVRASVTYPAFAAVVERACGAAIAATHLETGLRAGAAIQTAHALMLRRLVAPIAERALTGDWDEMPDPTQPGNRLVASALAFIVDVARPNQAVARALVQRCLEVPGLRGRAWQATLPDDVDAVVLALPAVLAEAPSLAGAVATRLALLHPDRCLEAAQLLASAPLPVRQAFAADLEKHLKRVFSVKRWVACRRALLGR